MVARDRSASSEAYWHGRKPLNFVPADLLPTVQRHPCVCAHTMPCPSSAVPMARPRVSPCRVAVASLLAPSPPGLPRSLAARDFFRRSATDTLVPIVATITNHCHKHPAVVCASRVDSSQGRAVGGGGHRRQLKNWHVFCLLVSSAPSLWRNLAKWIAR